MRRVYDENDASVDSVLGRTVAVKPIKPRKPVKPIQPVKPVQPVKPIPPVKPIKPKSQATLVDLRFSWDG
jgi:hypothetical protein